MEHLWLGLLGARSGVVGDSQLLADRPAPPIRVPWGQVGVMLVGVWLMVVVIESCPDRRVCGSARGQGDWSKQVWRAPPGRLHG